MNMIRRVRILATVAVSGIVVASSACSGIDAPTSAPHVAPTPERVSSFRPSEASKALIGVADGVYAIRINPNIDNNLSLGPNRLSLPAHSICRLGTSGYGSAYWDRPCTPQATPLVLTVTVKNAASKTPYVDFQPAMRFNPNKSVQIFFYVPQVNEADKKAWNILYCGSQSSGRPAEGGCVNEALSDADLTTYIDYGASVLFRRIKHFSGYVVSEM